MLQGRMPGVTIISGGQPGKNDPTINIRGIGTLGNTNPMVIIDGMESSLSNVAPNDIESVTVLKDAASASIYGVRAANGVILVTTKEGRRKSSQSRMPAILHCSRLPFYPIIATHGIGLNCITRPKGMRSTPPI